MNLSELEAAIEAILFAAGEAVSITRLAAAIDLDVKQTRKIIRALSDKYMAEKRGLEIAELEDSFQMCTNKDYFNYIGMYAKVPRKKQLTQALMETLAIIAYKQPVTKSQIENIRGVNADHAVNKLIEYGLVIEKGRAALPGKPIIFGTSNEFLRAFGFSSLSQLPLLGDGELTEDDLLSI